MLDCQANRPFRTWSTSPLFHVSSRNSLLQVASIGPAYSDYRQLIIDNDLTGRFIADKSESALTSALEDIGFSKELHIHRIMIVFMQLKSGDEAVLAAASSHASI
jgi:hypothetical protein